MSRPTQVRVAAGGGLAFVQRDPVSSSASDGRDASSGSVPKITVDPVRLDPNGNPNPTARPTETRVAASRDVEANETAGETSTITVTRVKSTSHEREWRQRQSDSVSAPTGEPKVASTEPPTVVIENATTPAVLDSTPEVTERVPTPAEMLVRDIELKPLPKTAPSLEPKEVLEPKKAPSRSTESRAASTVTTFVVRYEGELIGSFTSPKKITAKRALRIVASDLVRRHGRDAVDLSVIELFRLPKSPIKVETPHSIDDVVDGEVRLFGDHDA